ncbi:MOSC domain-containing protein [Micromonospora sp. C31]|uniref:MOSC domain-containing protein n=1 Tax=Micromonospora sp. C31 TaxID=2824876 RepID=UPI001B38743F|nr:MOSC domain-containing protein [Micromonospora sp. C31]MBQ1075626.1 MOSC domain-containing protein [Micromonospora sp. C31]
MDNTRYEVARLCRFPVKSMLGEFVQECEFGFDGLTGDRGYALVDDLTGLVASAKRPRRWRALLTCSARVVPAGSTGALSVEITFPDGKTGRTGERWVDDALSELLDRRVHLVDRPPPGAAIERANPLQALVDDAGTRSAPVHPLGGAAPGTFFDFAPIHLLTTAALRRIGELGGPTSPVRYRPNLVVSTPEGESGFLENSWAGRRLLVGSDVLLDVIVPTPRCAVPTLDHGSLPADRAALSVPARHNRIASVGNEPCAGAYARVVRPGRVRTGDRIQLVG